MMPDQKPRRALELVVTCSNTAQVATVAMGGVFRKAKVKFAYVSLMKLVPLSRNVYCMFLKLLRLHGEQSIACYRFVRIVKVHLVA